MHIAPDGKEGYLYTAEEVYVMLQTSKRILTAETKNQKRQVMLALKKVGQKKYSNQEKIWISLLQKMG